MPAIRTHWRPRQALYGKCGSRSDRWTKRIRSTRTLRRTTNPLILAIAAALFPFLREEKCAGSWDLQLDSRLEEETRQFVGSRIECYGSYITH